ncbi:FK506-binding protein 2 [Gracilariopsis chorda]|uniref:peptidylprolyl isomerase n=1 Tax=Gracilariopsis chorda TaxID=448386 RepID=A0A2V3IYX9_9FLOR|nr:FK506-binding protein 2 [Gracilariopsis chorda]|eukprot:PXF47366.1 FK506-binding protein 2 [Gracilariopsis chorda]
MRKIILLALLLAFILTVAHAVEELQIETIKTGDCSRKAKKGDRLMMHYAGTLEDGSEFDSSYKRGEPFGLVLGQGMVIKGWDVGLEGICKGEVRSLVIPPHMGYGDRGYPPVIPEKATLKFKVELVEFGPEEDDREL